MKVMTASTLTLGLVLALVSPLLAQQTPLPYVTTTILGASAPVPAPSASPKPFNVTGGDESPEFVEENNSDFDMYKHAKKTQTIKEQFGTSIRVKP